MEFCIRTLVYALILNVSLQVVIDCFRSDTVILTQLI